MRVTCHCVHSVNLLLLLSCFSVTLTSVINPDQFMNRKRSSWLCKGSCKMTPVLPKLHTSFLMHNINMVTTARYASPQCLCSFKSEH